MKLFSRLSVAAALLLTAAVARSQDPVLTPVPDTPVVYSSAVVHNPYAHPAPIVEGAPVALFHCVKVKDRDEMAPCAVTKIIHVQDPCYDEDRDCCCTGPGCVAVQICVPGCGCEEVTVRSNGKRVRYDYGKYAVDVRVKDGYIEIDYQD